MGEEGPAAGFWPGVEPYAILRTFMITLGRFRIAALTRGYLRLDGGAMFGAVPKTIWSRLIPPDEDNRIRLATRTLLVEDGERIVLVDLGSGDKWTDKLRRIYGIENGPDAAPGIDPKAVTDIVITHLHFDHAGGISAFKPGSATEVELRYPRARVWVQAANYETALDPNPRERASYLKENVSVLREADLRLVRGEAEIAPGLRVHGGDGHTRGHQWLEIRSGAETVAFPGDLIPTSRHLPLPYLMGYDMSAEILLREKAEFLAAAVEGRWIVVFEHDPDLPAALVRIDEKGHYAVGETVPL